MKIKKLALALLLALPSIGLISCSKKKAGYTVKVSVTDIGTARTYVDAFNTTTATENIKDSLVSKLKANANGAKITSIKVTYVNEKGRKIEDKNGGLDVNGKFEKIYNVQTGKSIIVTATAEGAAVADTMIARNEFQQAADKWAALAWTAMDDWAMKDVIEAAKKGWENATGVGIKTAVQDLKGDSAWYRRAKDMADGAWRKSGMAGKPAEVTLPTLSITIEKDGETITAQSVKASKNGLQPKDLTTAGKKTTVSATATAVAVAFK